jgi:DNA-binding GntR family transcriptional regulator
VELDHSSPTALYQQLAELLRSQIERGELTGRVPSAKGLAQEHGVAVGTAERALKILRADGLIVSAAGRGHFTVER